MSYRRVSLFLAWIFLIINLPFRNTATPAGTSAVQRGALQMQQTQSHTPGGTSTYRLLGQYDAGALGVAKLRALTVRGPNLNLMKNPNSGSPNMTPNSAEQERYDPGGDYYYSNSEISRSDGIPLVKATYEYEEPANRSVLYITISGVTLTFDLNTLEVGPITDVDEERLNAWLQSEDGQLVQDASVAIIEQGPEQVSPELLLNYYAVSMLVDDAPPSESASRDGSKGGGIIRNTLTQFEARPGAPAEVAFMKSCWSPGKFLVGDLLRPVAAGARAQCFGCCGYRCNCIRDRAGVTIYHQHCINHDRCSGRYGRIAPQCLYSLAGSIYVV